MKRWHRMGWVVVFGLGLAACSGGEPRNPSLGVTPVPSPTPPVTETLVRLTGVVQKGPFLQYQVEAHRLGPQGQLQQPGFPARPTGNGGFEVDVPQGSLVVLSAGGQFSDELSGEAVTLDRPLTAVVMADAPGVHNINVVTHLAGNQFLGQVAQGAPLAGETLEAAQKDITRQLGFVDGTVPGRLDQEKIPEGAGLDDPNLHLQLISAGVMSLPRAPGRMPESFDALSAALGKGTTPEDLRESFGLLNGLDAIGLAETLRNADIARLPSLNLPEDSTGWSCDLRCGFSGPPGVSIAGTTVYEGRGVAEIVVRRSGLATGAASVRLRTSSTDPESASPVFDYLPQDVSVDFAQGERSRTVAIPVVIDRLVEGEERFRVTLEAPSEGLELQTASALVRVLDDLPPGLMPAPATLSISRFCRLALGDGRLEAGDTCETDTVPVPLLEGVPNLLRLTLTLSGTCPSGGDCDALMRDWALGFDLVAREGNRERGRVEMGDYAYRKEALSVGLSPQIRPRPQVLLRFADPAQQSLISQASERGWTLAIEARTHSTPGATAQIDLPQTVILPATARFGDREVALLPGALGLQADSSCGAQGERLEARFLPGDGILGEGGLDFGDVARIDPGEMANLPLSSVCVRRQDGQLQVTSANLSLRPSIWKLPSGQGTRLVLPGRPHTSSRDGLLIFFGQNPALEQRLVLEGLPLEFLVSDVRLTETGVVVDYSRARSLTAEVGYSANDPRSGAALAANDILFRGGASAGQLRVTPNGGLSGRLAMQAGRGRLAYPDAELGWSAYELELVDGAIAADTPAVTVSYVLRQRTDCEAPGCVPGPARRYLASGDVQLAPGGHGLATLTMMAVGSGAEAPGFGSGEGQVMNFDRPEDLPVGSTATLAFAGFSHPATGVVAFRLPGHLQAGASGITLHGADSEAYRLGNFAPAGLSVGPEWYVGASRQPEAGQGRSLASLTQRIGGPQGLVLASQAATKYVLRRSGWTGVYNADPAALAGDIEFSGFPLQLSRLAFRVVDNRIDPETWIDGRFSIPGLAGLDDIVFASLQIDCAARLGQGRLVAEACDGIDDNGNGVIDEGCPTVLSAWAFPTTVQSLNFEAADLAAPQSCAAGPQLAVLGQSVQPLAINRPLSMALGWNPQGQLVRQTARDLRSYQLDGSEEHLGFGIRLTRAELTTAPDATQGGAPRGWLSGESRVALPFWEALEADVRLENQARLGLTEASTSLLLPRGTLDGLAAGQPNRVHATAAIERSDLQFDVRYRWGNTGFGFSLPAYYQPPTLAPGLSPQFIGVRKETDLIVINAGAGINFIEPERTKLSFGASADIAKLQTLEFQVNLEDGGSLKAVDNVLQRARLIRGPVLEPAYGALQSRLNVLNRFANEGLDRLTEAALLAALEHAGSAVAPLSPLDEDPVVSLSRGLTFLHSLPDQVVGVLDDEVRAPLLRLLADVERQTRQPLVQARSQLETLADGAPVPVSVTRSLQQVQSTLTRAESEAQRLEQALLQQVDVALDVVVRAGEPLAQTQAALTQVGVLLRQVTAFNASLCGPGSALPGEASGVIGPLFDHLENTQALLALVREGEMLVPIIELVVEDATVRDSLSGAQARITQSADALLVELHSAEAALKQNLCADDSAALLAQVRQMLQTTENGLQTVASLQQQMLTELGALRQVVVGLRALLLAPLTPISRELETVVALLEASPPPAARAVREALAAAEAQALDAVRLTSPVFAQAEVLIASNPARQVDVLQVSFDTLRRLIDAGYERALEPLRVAQGSLPLAQHTPDDLRRLLVSQIMASGPVQRLRREANAQLVEVHRQINTLTLEVADQVNSAVKAALARVEGEVNQVLKQATAPLKDLPVQSAKLDGYAVIAAQELERVHVAAEWTLPGGGEGDDAKTFGAALEAVSWSASNKTAGCSLPAGESRLDVKISAFNLPARFGVSELMMRVIELGFTLSDSPAGLRPVGLFGGLDTQGEIGFTEFIIYDPALRAGIGDREVYIGARAGAVFSDIAAEVAFLAGKTCNQDILASLDPVAGQFIPLPESGFFGAYVRGSATIPIIPGSCALSVSAVADVGAWVLAGPPATLGGLVGGGAIGRVGCLASLRGQVRAMAQVDTRGQVLFVGEGFGVAGVGFCEPATWTTVERSRKDSWCGTADALFRARYLGGWSILNLDVGGIY